MFCKLLNKKSVFIGSTVLLSITACNVLNGQLNYDELSQAEKKVRSELGSLINRAGARYKDMKSALAYGTWSSLGWSNFYTEMQRISNEIQRILTIHPKSTNFRFPSGAPLLWHAALSGVQSIVECFVNAGADLDAQHDTIGETALIAAVRISHSIDTNVTGFNYTGIIKFLVAKGAGIDSKNKKGLTPAALALKRNKLDIASYLISVYANIGSLENAFSNLPEHLVRARRNELEKILDQAGLPRDVYTLLIQFVTER